MIDEAHMTRIFPDDAALDSLADMLATFFADYRNRVAMASGAGLSPLDMDAFLAEGAKNPHRTRVLLQALAFMCSPGMLTMLWLVVHGANIRRLEYTYEKETSSHLAVDIALGDATWDFASDNHWDLAVLRFAAISKVDEQPMIESFYPLYIPSAPSTSTAGTLSQ